MDETLIAKLTELLTIISAPIPKEMMPPIIDNKIININNYLFYLLSLIN